MVFLGIVIGFIVGALALGWSGGLAGAFVGFIVMLAIRSRSQAHERMTTRPPPHAFDTQANVDDGVRDSPTMTRRLAAIESRLAALERLSGVAPAPPVPPHGRCRGRAGRGSGTARTRGRRRRAPVAIGSRSAVAAVVRSTPRGRSPSRRQRASCAPPTAR